jgi:hypothetical protein
LSSRDVLLIVHFNDVSVAENDRPTKACPDCAERVLTGARKCRFCGYRFDGAEEVTWDTAGDGLVGLLSLLRRPVVPPLTIAGYLARMGIDLEEEEGENEEHPVGIWLGRIDGADGYVVITNRRLFVTELGRHQGRQAGYLLSDLARQEVTRRRRRSTLAIEWRNYPPMVISKLSAKHCKDLHSILLLSGSR